MRGGTAAAADQHPSGSKHRRSDAYPREVEDADPRGVDHSGDHDEDNHDTERARERVRTGGRRSNSHGRVLLDADHRTVQQEADRCAVRPRRAA